MSEQDFLWKRDFKNINWQATLIYNLFRAFGAGIVFCIFQLISGEGLKALVLIPGYPIMYFIFLLPVGLTLNWLTGLGVPVVGWLNIIFALLVAIGDPLVFIFKKIKPELVPVDKPSFFSFKIVIFIVNEPIVDTNEPGER